MGRKRIIFSYNARNVACQPGVYEREDGLPSQEPKPPDKFTEVANVRSTNAVIKKNMAWLPFVCGQAMETQDISSENMLSKLNGYISPKKMIHIHITPIELSEPKPPDKNFEFSHTLTVEDTKEQNSELVPSSLILPKNMAAPRIKIDNEIAKTF